VTARCIYCTEDRPSSNEHVLLDGLGGKTTVSCVCKDCNHLFGDTIDRGLLRESPFVIDRLFDLANPTDKDMFVRVPSLGGCFDVRGNEILPQIFRTDGKWSLVGVEAAARASLLKFLGKLPVSIFHAVSPTPESEPTRLVIRDGKAKIRASSAEAAAEFEALVRSSQQALEALPAAPTTYEGMELEAGSVFTVTMNCDPNWPSRCAAKMVSNLAALHFGADFMLRSEFDGVRAYIVGTDVEESQTVKDPDGEDGWTMDVRYVENWLRPDPWDAAWPLPIKGHGLLLDARDGLLAGVVVLWDRPVFKVRLAQFGADVRTTQILPALLLNQDGREELLVGVLNLCLRLGLVDGSVPPGVDV
jgi:hypothetical protein